LAAACFCAGVHDKPGKKAAAPRASEPVIIKSLLEVFIRFSLKYSVKIGKFLAKYARNAK
jgi:hypothetical protein